MTFNLTGFYSFHSINGQPMMANFINSCYFFTRNEFEVVNFQKMNVNMVILAVFRVKKSLNAFITKPYFQQYDLLLLRQFS